MTNFPSENLVWDSYASGNYEESLPLLSALADQGDVNAMLSVAWIYEVGAVDSPNLELARHYYQRAVDSDSCDAMYRMGRILRKAGDLHSALEIFERGARQQHLPCINALGSLLVQSARNSDEVEEGLRWLRKAADLGHFFAKRDILLHEIKIERRSLRRYCLYVKLIPIQVNCIREYFRDKYSVKIL